MKKVINDSSDKELRWRAEEFINKNPLAIKEISPDDFEKLVEELQIYQVELEMQNEELRRSQLELEEERDKYSDLYDFAPVGYFTINNKGMILEANLTGADMLGVERGLLIGKPFSKFVNRDDHDIFYHHRQDLIETQNVQYGELSLGKKDGAQFHAQMEYLPVSDENGRLEWARIAVIDITERVQAEEGLLKIHVELESRVNKRTIELVTANEQLKREIGEHKKTEKKLRESEEKYRSLVESTEDFICLLDRDLRYLFTNDKLLSRYKLAIDKVIGRKYGELHSKKETKDFEEKVRRVFETGKPLSYEYKSQRDDRYFIRTLSPVRELNGRLKTLTLISKEFTERKRAEEALKDSLKKLSKEHDQRKLLSRQLIELLERERRQLSMDLHDDIGQNLAGIKMGCERVFEELENRREGLGTELAVLRDKTVQVMTRLSNFSNWLRPSILDKLGVISSLKQLFHDFRKYSGIKIHFYSKNIPERFEAEKELACFRIIQESLHNVVKHAGAKEVYVNFIKKDKVLAVSIEDDGVGFVPDRLKTSKNENGRLGLLIMEERSVQLGGTFLVDSRVGRGTHVLAEIPF